MVGGLVAGAITQWSHPRYSFLVYSIFGLFISIFACRLSPDIEILQIDQELEIIDYR